MTLRKEAHYLHANALAQQYLTSTEEWDTLRGKVVLLEKTTYSLQSIVARQVMKLIQDVEIINAGEVPRLRRGAMSLVMFKDLCSSVLNAVKYKAALHAQYLGSREIVALVPRIAGLRRFPYGLGPGTG